MGIVQTARPGGNPVDIEEAKQFLRVVNDEEDMLISSLISAATDKAEQITCRALAETEYTYYADEVPAVFKLPNPPLISVTSVQALKDGVYTDIDYTLNDSEVPAVIKISDTSSDDDDKAFKVVYTAGYKICPDAIKQWILVQVSTMYEQRETFSEKSLSHMPRTFVDHLLDSYRVRMI